MNIQKILSLSIFKNTRKHVLEKTSRMWLKKSFGEKIMSMTLGHKDRKEWHWNLNVAIPGLEFESLTPSLP